MARAPVAKPRIESKLKSRPAVGARVRIGRSSGLPRDVHGKTGTVVAHHFDQIAIVVRVDPQEPLRPFFTSAREFDRSVGLEFERRQGDWVVDYDQLREVAP